MGAAPWAHVAWEGLYFFFIPLSNLAIALNNSTQSEYIVYKNCINGMATESTI